MLIYLWIAIGSGLGGMARYWCSTAAAMAWGNEFPWGTIGINILGSLVIGITASLGAPDGRFPLSSDLRLFIMVGLCGGYTTFSSFSLQTLNLLQTGQFNDALLNIGLSVLLCLGAVALGYQFGHAFR